MKTLSKAFALFSSLRACPCLYLRASRPAQKPLCMPLCIERHGIEQSLGMLWDNGVLQKQGRWHGYSRWEVCREAGGLTHSE